MLDLLYAEFPNTDRMHLLCLPVGSVPMNACITERQGNTNEANKPSVLVINIYHKPVVAVHRTCGPPL